MGWHPKEFVQKRIEVEEQEREGSYGGHKWPKPTFEKNAFLVGLRGSGKSTVGRLLAERLGKAFVDTDDLIEARAGKTIAEIVAESGWEAFRDLESEALRETCAKRDQIVATGGGIVLREENRRLMKENGKVFYIMAEIPLLVERLENDPDPDKRPPLSDEALRDEMVTLMREREPLYMEIMDYLLMASKPLDEIVTDACELLS